MRKMVSGRIFSFFSRSCIAQCTEMDNLSMACNQRDDTREVTSLDAIGEESVDIAQTLRAETYLFEKRTRQIVRSGEGRTQERNDGCEPNYQSHPHLLVHR